MNYLKNQYNNNPIKIIYKYKNNNNKIKYQIYIFIGDVPQNIIKILNKIKTMSLLDVFLQLHIDDYKILENYYEKEWFKYFFTLYHIKYTIDIINKSEEYKKGIINKFGITFYENYLSIKKILTDNIIFSYETFTKNLLKSKDTKYETDEDLFDNKEINYIIEKNSDKTKIEEKVLSITEKQEGGELDDDEYVTPEIIDDDNEPIVYPDIEIEENNKDIETDEQKEIENINEIYTNLNNEIDKNLEKNTEELKKILNDDDLYYSKRKITPFNESYDNDLYNDDIKILYDKEYILMFYINEDDTIQAIKEKICCSIQMSKKYGKNKFILPEYQYLWSEYYFNNEVKKIMLGYKWLRNNELLNIDIEINPNMHVYEKLQGNLKLLRDNIKKYNSKIKKEDDNDLLLNNYTDFMPTNDIYLINIYDEFGLNYQITDEILKNLKDIYLKIYFPKITTQLFKQIISNKNDINELDIYNTYNTKLIAETEIQNILNNINPKKYEKMYDQNYITNVNIHILLNINNDKKISMHHIFNNFIVDETYPYVQYKSLDGILTHKLNPKYINEYISKTQEYGIIHKWIDTASYGISFKIKTVYNDETRYMSITINKRGRLEFKIIWKESSEIIMSDIKKTHIYVKQLLEKINKENKLFNFIIPNDEEYKYAFINSIQKINVEKPFNHNDLSNFARLFYPYVALIIEPKKRQAIKSKGSESGKFGTYLRYKKVNNYNIKQSIEFRIIFYMRNYEFTTQEIITVLSKQFNITLEKATEEYNKIKHIYQNIKKTKNKLKKLDIQPKYKYNGVDINIQGKTIDKYKLRISGTKNVKQLNDILLFMNRMIFLYYDTYINKNPDNIYLFKKLESLSHIAKRQHLVDEYIVDDVPEISIKSMVKTDNRLDNEHDTYSRLCQNIGKLIRRPLQVTDNDLEKIINLGYKYNKKLGIYEKTIKNKKETTVLKTIGITEYNDDNTNGTELHYACDPSINGEHMYIGFLANTNCLPCCFKKDPLLTKDKSRLEYFMKCLENKKINNDDKANIITRKKSELLYILHDSLNINIGRMSYLPTYIHLFLNAINNYNIKLINNYLSYTENYYLKMGCSQTIPYLGVLSLIFDKSIDDIKKLIINKLQNDKSNFIFKYLNNGTLSSFFQTTEKYINYINTSEYIPYEMLYDITSLPNVLSNKGFNIIIFEYNLVNNNDNKIDDYIIKTNFFDENKTSICLIINDNTIYPIINIKLIKDEPEIKYMYDSNEQFILNILKITNMNLNIIDNGNMIAKTLYLKYRNKYKFTYQYIDIYNKCIYLIIDDILIPVKPSGLIYELKIINNIEKYILSFDECINKFKNFEFINITGVYYTEKTDKDISINSLVINNSLSVPIKQETKLISDIENRQLDIILSPNYDKLNIDIKDKKKIYDERIININNVKYNQEHYELFRLEFSDFLIEHPHIKQKIIKIINNKTTTSNKINSIKLIIYKLIDDKILTDIYIKYVNTLNDDNDEENNEDKEMNKKIEGGKNKRFVFLSTKPPNIENYILNNDRLQCKINNNKNMCNINPHCHWTHSGCYFSIMRNQIIEFINKISEELVIHQMKSKEILQIEDYYVSDIIDTTKFTQREEQIIIKSTNENIQSILESAINLKYNNKHINYNEFNNNNPLITYNNFNIQNIIQDNQLYRAIANGYYYIFFNKENLGYYNELQTKLAIILKGKVIDYLIKKNESQTLIIEISKNNPKFIFKEIEILSHLIGLQINIYNESFDIIETFNKKQKHNIDLRFIYNNDIISSINTLYKTD